MVRITRYKGMCWKCKEYSSNTKLYRVGENKVCKDCLISLFQDGRYKNAELKQELLDELPELEQYAKVKIIKSTKATY